MAFNPSSKTNERERRFWEIYNNAPGEFSSDYTARKEAALDEYLGRKPFEYNADRDKSYNLYKKNYERAGKQGMKEAVGQATAMSGGYSNSYAEQVGQQTYNQYMAELESMLPQFEANALEKYNNEGNAMLNYYELLNNAEAGEYSKYQDKVTRHNNDMGTAYSLYSDSLNADMQKASFDEQVRQNDIANSYTEREIAASEKSAKAAMLEASKPKMSDYYKAEDEMRLILYGSKDATAKQKDHTTPDSDTIVSMLERYFAENGYTEDQTHELTLYLVRKFPEHFN